MYKISKQLLLSASHQLEGLPEDHPCSRLHGHNYVIEITMSASELNEVGFVRDYRELDEFKKAIDEKYDHRHLNNLFDFNPTAENLAKFFFDCAKQLYPETTAVTVKETDKTSATYEPGI